MNEKMMDVKRALVALDLSNLDQKLINYSKLLTGLLGIKTIYFVHIIPDFSTPKNLDIDFHKRFAPEYPIDEKIKNQLKTKIHEVFGDQEELEIQIEVIEGKPYRKLLHWIEVKKIDLLITGIKQQSQGSGITPKKVARKTKCPVCFVPEFAKEKIDNVLLPIDFSTYSVKGIHHAVGMRRRHEQLVINCLHVVLQPVSSYDYRMGWEDMMEMLMENAYNAYRTFLVENNFEKLNLKFTTIPNKNYNVARNIHEHAANSKSDLILMGAKGHTPFEDFLYGSVTESLVSLDNSIPVLVIR